VVKAAVAVAAALAAVAIATKQPLRLCAKVKRLLKEPFLLWAAA
ncbi:MAG: hypothetical protein RLZZ521_1513, partial [Pseudomonadota bacterium]